MTERERTPITEPAPAIAALIRNASDGAAWCERYGWPVLDLVIRLWFSLQLFAIETLWPLGPALAIALALGILVPPVAFLTLVFCLSIGIGFVGHAAEVALLVWLILVGASPLSLDAAFDRGVRSIALPGAGRLHALLVRLTTTARPVALLAFRLLAAAILGTAALDPEGGLARFVLSGWQPGLEPGRLRMVAILAAALLLTGFGVRIAGLIGFAVLAIGPGSAAAPLALLLALLGVQGGGALSLDRAIQRQLSGRYGHLFVAPRWNDPALPHVVIAGAGFGGIAAARGLRHTPCRITLIDRRNYHLFQPLLYQVATASLSPADIATPIRELFRDQPNIRVLLGRVTGVDRARGAVLVGDERVPFDHLIIGTGARHSYFGNEQWEPLAPGLKKIDDATDIRRRILLALERAEATTDPAERAADLTFVVVGGGPTGVEIAGTLVELLHRGLPHEFRNCDPREARVILVNSGPLPLAAFPDELSDYARRALEDLGVEVRAGTRVEHVDEDGVIAGGARITARTVIWSAGVVASPASRWLGAAHDRAGRVEVGADLSVPGSAEIFVVGDTALSAAWDGRPVPGLAPAAKQGGAYVARVVHNRIVGRAAPPSFRYHHEGSLATIGRKAAVVDFGWIRLKGAVAWWFWGGVHVLFLIGARNRLAVVVNWFWAYLTFKRSTRLITGPEV